MSIITVISSFFIAFNLTFYHSESSPAMQLLDKSIQYHDASGNWSKFKDTLHFVQESPEGTISKRKVYIDNDKSEFSFWSYTKEGTIHFKVSEGKAKAFWNGSEVFSKEVAEKYRISTERALMYRDYYLYLYGLPMKLKDPGTIIHPEVKKIDFYGLTRLRIKVSYAPEVGNDIWYFYFDPKNSALNAYQFYHDESQNDGEYILLNEASVLQGMNIPKIRDWYTNKENKLLGRDILSN